MERVDGSDGPISCWIKTEPLAPEPTAQSAIEFEDYLPIENKITFIHNETQAKMRIELVNAKMSKQQEKGMIGKTEEEEDERGGEEESEDEPDVIFKVKLAKPEPHGVKISKKNVCMVHIIKAD